MTACSTIRRMTLSLALPAAALLSGAAFAQDDAINVQGEQQVELTRSVAVPAAGLDRATLATHVRSAAMRACAINGEARVKYVGDRDACIERAYSTAMAQVDGQQRSASVDGTTVAAN